MRMLTPTWSSRGLTTNFSKEFDRFFEEFNKPWAAEIKSEAVYAPAVEIVENDKYYLLSFDLPGVKKEDFKIEFADGELTVSGQRKREMKTDKGEKIQRLERAYGSFSRVFTIPKEVNSEEIKAKFENGLLEIELPKKPQSTTRTIEVL